MVNDGNFTLLMTASGQQWPFHIANYHLAVISNVKIAICDH